GEGSRIVVVAVDVVQQVDQPRDMVRRNVDASVLEAVARAPLELIQRPDGLGDADDRAGKPLVTHQRMKRGENLLVREIAGRPEEDDRVGGLVAHAPSAGFSTWPPNSKRSAESNLSAYSAWPRELKRENRAELMTGAGTPSSIAACNVQRPSPESDTRPAKFSRFGLFRNALAVRSSSHEPTTLPRRHTSATCAMSMS